MTLKRTAQLGRKQKAKREEVLKEIRFNWTPWLGSVWFTGIDGGKEKRELYIKQHRDYILEKINGMRLVWEDSESLNFSDDANEIIVVLANEHEKAELMEMRAERMVGVQK